MWFTKVLCGMGRILSVFNYKYINYLRSKTYRNFMIYLKKYFKKLYFKQYIITDINLLTLWVGFNLMLVSSMLSGFNMILFYCLNERAC
jgi:hypothetical protein